MRGGKVSLHASFVQLDLAVFVQRLRALAAADAGSAAWAALAHRALQIYRRPLLADDGDAPWLHVLREHWGQRWLALVGQLAAHHESVGDAAALRLLLDDAVQADGACGGSPCPAAELARLRRQHLKGPTASPRAAP